MDSKIESPLSLMRSISVSPESVMVIDSLVEPQNAVAQQSLGRAELPLERLVDARDRGADALGMTDDACAFATEPVDQRADAYLVLG